MQKRSAGKTILLAAAVLLVSFFLTYSEVFFSLDTLLTDPLFQRPGKPDNRIRIIAIDEKTLAEYGEFADWQRDIPCRLVELLSADESTAPAVIGFDVMFISERDPEADAAFAAACAQAGNVVTAADLVFRTEVTLDGGTLIVDEDHIESVEYPYDALRAASSFGFANAYHDRDSFIRYSRISVDHPDGTICSFPAAVYTEYCRQTGLTPSLPRTDGSGYFHFAYTARTGDYEHVSLCDVLDGTVDARTFMGCIVLVGAYAPGMQDSYSAPIDRSTRMYGVEIQANILQAIMQGKTALPVSRVPYAAVVGLLALAYYLISKRMKIVPAAILGAGIIAAWVIAAKLLFGAGHVGRLIEPILAVVILYALDLVVGYILETLKKRRILNAFRKYVAPQVVQEVAEKGDFSIVLGGEKRHIAVLFVDIRGFTTMSEGLDPEEVVEILNEYLALTTDAIFKNSGTLDKFIGDAAMAVFNAPFDLDDYVYRAVCTARDIAAGSGELERRLTERFGRSVSFGIGVNCGDAVVGNIGCDFRMDYTAIGDTVNTAARLESNAKRGQILISEAVYRVLEGRIRVTEVGAIPLKGKSNEVIVYQLDEVLETPPAGEGSDTAC